MIHDRIQKHINSHLWNLWSYIPLLDHPSPPCFEDDKRTNWARPRRPRIVAKIYLKIASNEH
jgi:hypothetical protein